MNNYSNIYTQIEPEIREKAEQVLSRLGIPVSNAINLFLYQVVLQQGIPFDVKLPQNRTLDYSTLAEEQFDSEIEKGFLNIAEGKTFSAKHVRDEMERQYRL